MKKKKREEEEKRSTYCFPSGIYTRKDKRLLILSVLLLFVIKLNVVISIICRDNFNYI